MHTLIRLKKATPLSLLALGVVCIGFSPLVQAVVPAPDGGYPGGNTAEGQAALFSLTSGTFNTAVGFLSLRSTTDANFNTAIGAGALLANAASSNTATGAAALLSNTAGGVNTANGAFALFSNTGGSFNTATGFSALSNNTTGFENTATGVQALESNTIGSNNTANGSFALSNNTVGSQNTATGFNALFQNTGALNTANGSSALANNTSGSGNIALGAQAGSAVTTASNVIAIGHPGANVNDSCFISQIFGKPVGNDAVAVLVDSFGKVGTMSSSQRFKKEIRPMDKVSESILGLKPVTFHYKSDKTNTAQFGLIAEDVAKVNPDLVVRDKNGEIYTVRYEVVNAMLLNEFLKEHRKVESLVKAVAEQQKENAAMRTMFKEQAAQIQKLSAQIELSKAAPQTVLNNH
jgi:Chaperone of endosialidase